MIFKLFSLRIPVVLNVADLNSDRELYEDTCSRKFGRFCSCPLVYCQQISEGRGKQGGWCGWSNVECNFSSLLSCCINLWPTATLFFQLLWETFLLIYTFYLGSFTQGWSGWAWIWPLVPSRADVKNGWSYTSTPPYVFMGCRRKT